MPTVLAHIYCLDNFDDKNGQEENLSKIEQFSKHLPAEFQQYLEKKDLSQDAIRIKKSETDKLRKEIEFMKYNNSSNIDSIKFKIKERQEKLDKELVRSEQVNQNLSNLKLKVQTNKEDLKIKEEKLAQHNPGFQSEKPEVVKQTGLDFIDIITQAYNESKHLEEGAAGKFFSNMEFKYKVFENLEDLLAVSRLTTFVSFNHLASQNNIFLSQAMPKGLDSKNFTLDMSKAVFRGPYRSHKIGLCVEQQNPELPMFSIMWNESEENNARLRVEFVDPEDVDGTAYFVDVDIYTLRRPITKEIYYETRIFLEMGGRNIHYNLINEDGTIGKKIKD